MKCPKCKNELFSQTVTYKVEEKVKLVMKNNTIEVESHDIIDAEPMEHINEYKCMKCGTLFTIEKINGGEVLVLLE